MDDRLLTRLACPLPGCRGRLAGDPRGSARAAVLRCRRCRAPYPVLGGIPILVPDPAGYLASFHDAVLASLAEAGRASRDAVRLVADFAAAAPAQDRMRFGDDWVAAEVRGTSAPLPADAPPELAALLALARRDPPHRQLLALGGGHRFGATVEVGPGAGVLTAELRRRASSVLVLDLSLRSVLLTLRRARRGRGSPVAGVVADAADLPLASRRARTIVAAHVIDLLESPADFVGAVAAALPPGGRLLLSTPAPHHGDPDGDPRTLDRLLSRAGLRVEKTRDGVPWLREHGPRHVEIYVVRLVCAAHPR